MKNILTLKEIKLIKFLQNYKMNARTSGTQSPKISEMMEYLGEKSSTGVQRILYKLEGLNLIDRVPYKHRGWLVKNKPTYMDLITNLVESL